MREELLEIYSSSGKKTGKKATKSYIHKKGLFHATVHVWIFSEKGNVLIPVSYTHLTLPTSYAV